MRSLEATTTLHDSILTRKRETNRRYLLDLQEDSLLLNYRLEAGVSGPHGLPGRVLGGWEAPTCQVRGHFTGHWLSASALLYAVNGDARLKARVEYVVGEIAKCQHENGGRWCFAIPEKYLWWIRDGKSVWAPQYTAHKLLMGLIDAWEYAGVGEALAVAERAAEWFTEYTDGITREAMDDLMDRTETGGMMEAWADLYRHTGRPEHLELMRRYERPRYYAALLTGEDVLTNEHANTTIPEVLGACKAYEITGEGRYLDIARAYWDLAVTRRGYYATGGQTCGEVWSPVGEQSARLGNKNQEHCTVYNMMRLAEFLFRQDGDPRYADYWERNLYNGILAQGYYIPNSAAEQTFEAEDTEALISYFLPMEAGARKYWGSGLDHFWCCHGTLVQANALMLQRGLYYAAPGEALVCQFFPSRVRIAGGDMGLAGDVSIRQEYRGGGVSRPTAVRLAVDVDGGGQRFALKIRLPWWLAGEAVITDESGGAVPYTKENGYARVERAWGKVRLHVDLPKTITVHPLPDRPDTVAFLDGPVVLAGLTDREQALSYDPAHPDALFAPDDERQWGVWNPGWRTVGQAVNLRFLPLYWIRDQRYTTYFPRAGA